MKQIIILITLAALFVGCAGDKTADQSEEETAQVDPEATHSEGNSVSLTTEQIKTAGITLGPIEMKNLRTSIRANGTLSVPNQNKALITSLS
ncbi:MAG TPA: efflux RND transporter periplasmic adaptor subunit, partial [Sphingobacteriaceae bacterium]